ncbi:hypothetical protein [Aliikangiella coralliicola]|uniref:Uncharacterized protein n=1 Tax=Aliikangiella coralliicola TaxID=2592383 RepID=A0A545TS90_9GAMM|nr:hypothetical protein [Aliikangiella coralliicola]TQV80011.1 hypothetical protein FLL46_26755 [Aliikangiella coralliicola]
MNTPKLPHNSSKTLQTITDKRLALEKLINIACSVQNQHKALSEVALAAKPSQEFPKKTVAYFKAIEKHMAEIDSAGLLQKLEVVEGAISQSIKKLIRLAKINVSQLRNDEISHIDIDTFKHFIDDFKRRTQTSLALRFILKKRGMAIAPFKLPLSQESIAEQIDTLKEKERGCVKQIRSEIQSIIEDTQNLLLSDQLPSEIRLELENVQTAMAVNIKHLDNGGSVDEIPNVYEVITLESEPAYGEELAPQEMVDEPEPDNKKTERQAEIKPETQPHQKAPRPQPKSFWWLLKTWLTSPWSTSWQSIKEKYRDDDQ